RRVFDQPGGRTALYAAGVLRRRAGRARLGTRRARLRTDSRYSAGPRHGLRGRQLHADDGVPGPVLHPAAVAERPRQEDRLMGQQAGGWRHSKLAGKLALVVLAIICISLPFWAGPYWIRIGTGIAMWAGLALSWNVICGYAGYISFGHVAFFGIGAYATAILMQPQYGWNFFATLPVGMLVAGGLAAIIGWPVLKLRGSYFAIGTWALGEAIREFATVVPFTGGSYGMSVPANLNPLFFYFVMLGTTTLAYVACYVLLERSRFGYRVKAV